jgi:hypothetical protein
VRSSERNSVWKAIYTGQFWHSCPPKRKIIVDLGNRKARLPTLHRINHPHSESTYRMVESTYVDPKDPQLSFSDQPLSLTHQGSEFGGEEPFNSFRSTWEQQSRTDYDDGSFEIPKGAEKVELGEDELKRTFEAIIEAHPEILESTKPTAGLSQLREVQELARDDQLRFQSWVIGRRCSRTKEKGKE